MQARGKYTGGSIASFIIIGIVLCVVFGTVAYVAMRRSAQVAEQSGTGLAAGQEESTANGSEQAGQSGEGAGSSEETVASTQSSESENGTVSSGAAGSSSMTESAEESATGGTDSSVSSGSTVVTELPETGASPAMAVIALGALSLAGVYYFRSRAHLSQAFDVQ